jgi:hypothetical protein
MVSSQVQDLELTSTLHTDSRTDSVADKSRLECPITTIETTSSDVRREMEMERLLVALILKSLLKAFKFHYTQRCLPKYYPYDFLGSYYNYNTLIITQTSVDALINTASGNLDWISLLVH